MKALKKNNIQNYRKKINAVDEKIIRLLNDRLDLALKIGKLKKDLNLQVYDASREAEVYKKIFALNNNFPQEFLKKIYSEIMAASRLVERQLRIVYLGPAGSFTHIAAKTKFPEAELISASNIPIVFTEVEKNAGDYGIVPVENSNNGVITYTFDRLLTTSLKITGETLIRISHNLLSSEKKIEDVKIIYSHSQSFGQCENWISANLGGDIKLMPVDSNSRAAELAASEKNSAAIASLLAGEIYNLNVLAKNIEDFENNTTRFLVIGKNENKHSYSNKTSIAFATKDRVGILHKCLQPFAKNKINLTKIESRPYKSIAWNYVFFVDFLGNTADPKIAAVLKQLERYCSFIKILGSYHAE